MRRFRWQQLERVPVGDKNAGIAELTGGAVCEGERRITGKT